MDLIKKNKSYLIIKKIYILIYIFLVIQRACGPMKIITPVIVDTAIFYLLSLVGIILILYDLFNDKVFLKMPNNGLLCLFLISVLISTLLNINYGNLFGNINKIILLSFQFFIFYAIDFKRTENDIDKEIEQIEHYVMIIWFIAVILSIILFLTQYYYYYDLPDGKYVRVGVVENRLFGIFNDPNYAAVISTFVIIFLVKNFIKHKQNGLRIFYSINMFFQFVYIVLSGSRTGNLTLAVAVLFISYLSFRRIFYKKSMSYIKVFIFSSVISILILMGMIIFHIILEKVLIYIPNLLNIGGFNIGERTVSLKRDDVENSSDISNLRFKIWSSALELFKTKPIFGLSNLNILPYAQSKFPLSFIAQRKYICHSFYIETLVSTGIVGSVLLFSFIIKNVLKATKTLFKVTAEKQRYFSLVYSFTTVVIMLCSGIFLSDLIFNNSLGSLIFWLYLGYTMYLVNYKDQDINFPLSYKILDKVILKLKNTFSK